LDLTNPNLFEQFIENYLLENNSKVAFGGYLEKRNLYKRSSVFNHISKEERNIHLGLDLWIKADTSVLAALDGKVHSFQNNKSLGDYGPTIILEHEIDGRQFFTLYGHLATESLDNLFVGKPFSKGDQAATISS
jgi:murein DD-endopeptidase MepM/ murein hydrolase activator NlpD